MLHLRHLILLLLWQAVFGFITCLVTAQTPLKGIRCELEPAHRVDSFTMPVLPAGNKTWQVTNDFGNRVTNKEVPGLPSGTWQHTGVDYLLGGSSAASQNQPVYAAGNGVVVFSTKSNTNPLPSRGGLIIIRHLAPQGSTFAVVRYNGKAGSYEAFETGEVLTYYLHLDANKILVNTGDQVVAGERIAQTYDVKDYGTGKKYVYAPHLHFEVWSVCSKTELNGYEPDGKLQNSLRRPVIDPVSFLTNVRITGKPTPFPEVPLVSVTPYNVAFGKPVHIVTNGANDPCNDCEKEWADITDGRFDYEPGGSGKLQDGVVGWQNNDYGELMEIKVTIDLGQNFNISKIRYTTGNVMRAETWNADLMITPFGRTATNPGINGLGRWTEQTGIMTASEVTITFQKTRRRWEEDWLFIGEIEIIGTPATSHNTSWVGTADPQPSW